MHHANEALPVSHHHTMDLHVIYEQLGHDHHDKAAVIDNINDFLIKQLDDNPLSVAIFIILVLTLAVVRIIIRHRLLDIVDPRQDSYQLSPPLRAPPIH
jgi:hypothetical protein